MKNSTKLILLFLLILTTSLNGQVNKPNWSVDPNNYSFDMEVTAQVFFNQAPVLTNGILGAFVDGVLQGVQNEGLVYSDKFLFILRVYSNTAAAKTVTFKYYDTATDKVYDIPETLAYVADYQSGNAVSPVQLHAVSGNGGKHNQPDWAVNPRDFGFDGEVFAEVVIDKTVSTQSEGILAAFVGTSCRGMVQGGAVGPTGKFVRQLRCYTDAAAGETITFKYYDAIQDTVLPLVETVSFESNMIVGTAMNPYTLHTLAINTATRALSAGWNWFSMNLQNFDMSVGAVLANLNPTEGDYIKSMTQSAVYYAGYGWFGDLQMIDAKEMYKLKLAHADVLKFDGYPVNPATNPITINNGWTWVGYIPQTAKPLNEVLSGINPAGNDYIKGTGLSSTYYTGSGWFGALSQMQPLQGYAIWTNHTGTLVYADGGFKSTAPLNINAIEVSLKPEGFQYSGQITAAAYIDGRNIDSDSFTLYAMVDGQIRGESRAMLFTPTGEFVNNFLTYSNNQTGDIITFRLHDEKNDTWYEYSETVIFTADMLKSSALIPLKLQTSHLLEPRALSLEPSVSVWPNPVKSAATISYALATEQSVTIQVLDFSGRVINELNPGNQEIGENQINWDTRSLSGGVYYLKMKNSNSVYQKVVVVK